MKHFKKIPLLMVAVGLVFFVASCKSPSPATGPGANVGEGGDVVDTSPTSEKDMEGTKETERLSIGKDGVQWMASEWGVVHFDYDSAAIKQGDRKVLEDIAKWAKENTGKKILVGGHCDERGTLEYNRALGQRRALAARQYLIKLGVSAKRVGTVSYGEEQPAEQGHNEEAWSKNRRDEFGIVK